MSTAIIGAGIIGVSTAYYLSQSPQYTPQGGYLKHQIHLLDTSPELFASASGFAAGFLARDWFSPATAALGELSFDLHRELASEFGGREKWGYSPSTGISPIKGTGSRGDEWLNDGGTRAAVAPRDGEEEDEVQGSPSWMKRTVKEGVDTLSTGETTAQIDPLKLCTFLLEACLSRGVRLHHPVRPVALITNPSGRHISGVRLENPQTGQNFSVPCSRIVIAAGAWSSHVFKTLFPSAPEALPVSSLAGHSLLVRSPKWTEKEERRGCHAVFTTDDDEGFSPEIFSRLGGEIYVAGLNHSASELLLPDLPGNAKPRDEHIESLERVAEKIIAESEITRKSLCFRPIIRNRSTPIVSGISDHRLGDIISADGSENGCVFVATGHGPWGISLSLGTGKVVAEMVEGRKTSVSVSGLRW